MKEILINIIGPYQVTDFYWLDVPWCMSAAILILCSCAVIFGLMSFMSRFSR